MFASFFLLKILRVPRLQRSELDDINHGTMTMCFVDRMSNVLMIGVKISGYSLGVSSRQTDAIKLDEREKREFWYKLEEQMLRRRKHEIGLGHTTNGRPSVCLHYIQATHSD